MKRALSKVPAKKLAAAQANKLSFAAKRGGWSASKVSRRAGLFAFANSSSIRVLSWPDL